MNTQKGKLEALLKNAGNVLALILVYIVYILVPLYYKNGYERIATRKYQIFMETSLIALVLFVLFFVVLAVLRGISAKDIQKYKKIRWLDYSMLAYLVVNLISYAASPDKSVSAKGDFWYYEGSFYGTSGWYMGLATVLIILVSYYAISRTVNYTDKIWIPIIIVATFINIWGGLNRFNYFPIKMELFDEKFVSSIGNINWYAGYLSVTIPVVLYFYWKSETFKTQLIYLFPMIVSVFMVLLNGSDSIIASFLVEIVILWLCSCSDTKRMLRMSEIILTFSFSCMSLYLSDNFLTKRRSIKSDAFSVLDGGKWSIIWFVLGLAFFIIVLLINKGFIKYPAWCKKNLGIVGAGFFGALILLLPIFIIINTLAQNSIPLLKDAELFYFCDTWGSSRGAIFRQAFYTFLAETPMQKLFGVGPDAFCFQVSRTAQAVKIGLLNFGDLRVTNAHCELLTILINSGIIGLMTFISTISAAIAMITKRIKKESSYFLFFSLIVMYLFNNMVSFEHLLNTPQFFVALGLLAGKVAREDA